ncbi:hypothetical protein JCM14469_03920 [Desulfatiferula olefinivorans]
MSKDDGNSIFDELDSRLDDFFADDEPGGEDASDFLSDDLDMSSLEVTDIEHPTPDVPASRPNHNAKAPLDALKAIVLEMDWEINDENLNNYLDEINRLKDIYRNDRPISLFLKLHDAIGQYMLHKKAGAHPDALKFLYQVFNSLEKVFTKEFSLREKNTLILTEVANFKNLKAKLFPNLYTSVDMNSFVPDVSVKKKKPDFSSLPNEIQKEINDYIEREIAQKIETLKKELIKR